MEHFPFHLCFTVLSLLPVTTEDKWMVLRSLLCSLMSGFHHSFSQVWIATAFGFGMLGVAICQYLYIDMKGFFFLILKEGVFCN